MAHWRRNHEGGKWLKHYHLLDEAKSTDTNDVFLSPVVQISAMTTDVVKSKEKPAGEKRNVAHFKGKALPMAFNVGHCEALESISGSSDPKRWVGVSIQLFVDKQARLMSGKKGPALRIAPTRPRGKPVDDGPLPDVSPENIERLDAAQQAAHEREPGED